MDRMAHGALSRRRFLGGSLAAGALAALSACTSGGQTEQIGAAVAEQPLTIGFSRPASIDPALATDTSSLTVVWQLFDCLTSYDFSTGELSCLAAERYEVSDDAQTFTFYLRDATFHDGSRVTSEDFKRAWERIVSPSSAPSQLAGATPYAYLLSLIDGYDALHIGSATEFAGVTCPDSATLSIRLSTPYADLPYLLAHPVLGPVPPSADDDLPSFSQRPIGNGPFMMTEPWKHNQYISLARFEDYYGEKPSLDGVYMSIQKNPDTAFNEFQAGSIDFASIPSGKIKECIEKYGESKDGFTSTPRKQCLLGTELSTYFLIPSPQDPVLADPKVRRAVSLAINRQNIVDTLFEGSRKPATSIMPTSIDDSPENVWEDCKYDPEAAAKLLDEAGYPANADGKRDVEITLNYNGDGDHGDLMSAVQLDLEAVGIKVTQETVEWATYLQQLSDKNFSLGRLGWTADYPTMDNFLYPNFFTGADNNYEEYSNPEMDAAMLAARQIQDEEERKAACRKICGTIGKDMPVIPIMFYAHNYIGSERMKSFNYDTQTKPHFETAELA